LTLIFSAGMALVLFGLGTFVYVRLGADLLASVDLGLRSRAQVLTDAVGSVDEQALVDAKGKLLDPDEAFAQVLDASGRVIDASSAVSGAALLGADVVSQASGPMFITRRIDGFDDPVRLLAVVVIRPAGREVVVVGATLGDLNDAMARLLLLMAAAGPLALGLTSGAGWLLAGAALRPVERMRREAAAISASEPDRRLPVPETADELARLATTLNGMLDRLQEALERERRFVDDASHELRTPLATLRAQVDLALARRRAIPELQAALRSVREDVARLQQVADDLLVLARSRRGRIPVRRVRTSLARLASDGVASVARLVETSSVTVDIEVLDEPVDADSDRVVAALRNLLENAVRHSPRGGHVRLSASRTDGTVNFVVADSGPGFPNDLLATAFEPFTQGHGESAGGAGLGLAIVRAVAEAHEGSAWAENTPTGARVTLSLHA
jgi:signal transduction histidine kinase